MINTALYFLHRVARGIPHNHFATAFFNQLKKAGDAVDVNGLDFLEIPFEEKAVLEEMDYSKIERNQDYRFLYLYLKSVRKFPPLSDDGYFGVSFCDEKDIPTNTLLQGGNGTGKTSIFGAMEYLFTGNMSAAMKQGFSDIDGLERYLPYADGGLSGVDINVVTRSLHFSLGPDGRPQKNLLPLNLLPFFCSEYDVDRLIKDGLDEFIYEQMGYTYVSRIIQNIEDEIGEAVSRHDTLNYTPDSVVSQISELDTKIGMYERLKPSFLSFIMTISNQSKPNKLLNQCNRFLSKDIILGDGQNTSSEIKPLDAESLKSEMDVLSSALGKNAQSQYLMLQYSKVSQFLQTDAKKEDSLLEIQARGRDNLKESIEELNLARRYFNQIISEIFVENLSSDIVSDVVSYAKKLDDQIQDLKNERQQEENKKEILGKDKRFSENKETYEEFLKHLKSEFYRTVKTVTEGARKMLNEVMDLFVMEDEEMRFDFDEKDGTFSMRIALSSSGNSVSYPFLPEQYLNTFRYKLYCMTLKIAIAFAVKQFYKMNFPIVIDDIFYSSDFTHRGMVRNFFRILFEKHRELFPSKDLQIIFLSHDDVVIEAAYRGISDIVTSSRVERQMMFDYREADPPNKVRMPITSNRQQKVINIINLACS